MRRYVFDGGTAVVTGAASGIGAALAGALSDRSSHLVLLDREGERLEAVAAGLRRSRPDLRVRTHLVDLADAAAVDDVAQEILVQEPGLTLLVNNAGVALGGRFGQITMADFQWVMDVNFRAVVQLTHTLLPALTAHPGSHLVNVSSVYGLMAQPGQTAYAASKFAVRGFTEALRGELADDQVGVTLVHPGGIRTRIAESARVGAGVSPEEEAEHRAAWDRILTIDPADAAAAIMDGIENRRARVLIGLTATVPDVVARLLPGSYGGVLSTAQRLQGRLPR